MPVQRRNTTTAAPAKPAAAAQKQEAAKPAATSKADIFNKTRPQGQTAPGKYEALLVEGVLQGPTDNGQQSVRISYEVAEEGDFKGNRLTAFYTLWTEGSTEENSIPGRGIEFIKKDLAVLGLGDVSFDNIEEALADLTNQKPGVIITTKENKGYLNVYLNGLAEGSEQIEAYRESRGF